MEMCVWELNAGTQHPGTSTQIKITDWEVSGAATAKRQKEDEEWDGKRV